MDEVNASEVTITEEDNRQREKGNTGRCFKQASKKVLKKVEIMEKLVAMVHPKSSHNILYVSEKWKEFGNLVLVIYKGIDYLILLFWWTFCFSCPECFEVGSLSLEEDYDRKKHPYLYLHVSVATKRKLTHPILSIKESAMRNNAGAKAYEIYYSAVYDMYPGLRPCWSRKSVWNVEPTKAHDYHELQ